MTIEELLKDATKSLAESGVTDTPRLDAEVLLAHVLDCDRLKLIINSKSCVSDFLRERFSLCLNRRLSSEPISYILGYREFMSLKFFVSPGVLIPRPDTEVLAEFAIQKAKEIKNPHILDLCTGSGALAVSIAKYVNGAETTAIDFSPVCIEHAKKNAAENGVVCRVNVILQDILEDFSLNKKFDILVSNPPYIKTEVINTLEKNVKDFEPTSALDGGDDGLIFYRRITEIAPALLKSGGTVAFEIGYDQYDEVYSVLENKGYKNISYLCDLAGIKRVICAVLP